ncbi:helix-turn-helix domain-containing protein [Kutzneria sp. NPDC052558]|uniref:helix-turn-helix domain-containing protein n=1 Tax=Kutzneria sp. NPDC052558 TaxID=3364121 RepID=UPI0037C924EC
MIEYAVAGGVEEEFGSLLRRLRTNTGLTQRMLADLSTISERAIRDLEQSRARPRTDTVRLIAEALRLGRRARAGLELAANHGRPLRPTLDAVTAVPPVALDAIIGRDSEIGAVTAELAGGVSRLVVLRGLPGVGKTRLAVEIARGLHSRSRLPVLWCTSPTAGAAAAVGRTRSDDWLARLLDTASRALFDPTAADDLAEVAEAIADRDALLVLDGGTPRADAVLWLLGECARLRVLVTTTDPESLPGERAFLLGPLAVPEDEVSDPRMIAAVPAVRLLLTHLDRIRPGCGQTRDEAALVAAVCAAVDGLPPALAAVASWHAVYDLPTLLDILRADPAALLDPSLLSQVDSHLALLSPGDRAALSTLADFTPDASLPELASATGLSVAATGQVLRSLILHGVIRVRQTTTGSRFQILSLVRARSQESPCAA